MEITEKLMHSFNAYKVSGEGFTDFLITDEQIAKLNSSEEIKEATQEMRLQLCDLIMKERELNHAKEAFLRALYILERKHIHLYDDGC